ncbi:FecR domain-containing protein [Chitinophaga cymbidii]|nr:FecR domain-containing protein [Chitinophaga cymbidii]
MEKRNAAELLEKYNAGTATEEERAWVETWYARFEDKVTEVPAEQVAAAEQESRRAFERRPRISTWPRIAAAACLLAAVCTLAYFITRQPADAPPAIVRQPVQDVAPGGNKAVLTLANGQQIVLDDAQNGQLASQSGITITKASNGQIVYTAGKGNTAQKIPEINTITTPKGGQYQVVLPDGTRVWLNAASSLKYPAMFSGMQRQVELAGEAYFEVAHDRARPFRVISAAGSAGEQVVEVLGTHFNINAYEDEAGTKTTLLEGAVKVRTASGKDALLKPGQQSTSGGRDLRIENVDTDGAVAWKNGYFLFTDEDLAGIMRKVSRWYDVEIEYKENALLTKRFSGTVSRYKNVSQVIKVLELTKAAKFNIEGKKIIVSQ